VTDVPVEREVPVRSEVIDFASLAVIVVLVALVALGATGLFRGLLALAFLTFVPGWAIVTNWTSAARVSRVALSVLLSLSISTAAATTALWLHLWHPLGLFYLMALASAAAIIFGLVRRRTAAPPL
jgi:uncharacterized membrane protein